MRHLGTNWSMVTAWATIVLAIVTGGLALAAAFAVVQVKEARAARYGQVVAEVARRWDSEALIASRVAADRCLTDEELRREVERTRELRSDKTEYYRLLTEPDFYEDIALLELRSAIEYETLRVWMGPSLIVRYEKWRHAIEYLRTQRGGTDSYIGWERLAQRLRADQSGGRASLIRPRFLLSLGRSYVALGRHSS